MEIPCCLSLFVEKTVTQFSSCTKSSGSRDTELCSNLPWNSLKNFIEIYGFIFINTAVYLKSSLQKEVIKDFHSGIQGREYPWDRSRNLRSPLPDIELVRKERKTETNKQTKPLLILQNWLYQKYENSMPLIRFLTTFIMKLAIVWMFY